MSCVEKEFNLFPRAGKLVPSAGKQLSGVMRGNSSTCVHMQVRETSKLGSCQKHRRQRFTLGIFNINGMSEYFLAI